MGSRRGGRPGGPAPHLLPPRDTVLLKSLARPLQLTSVVRSYDSSRPFQDYSICRADSPIHAAAYISRRRDVSDQADPLRDEHASSLGSPRGLPAMVAESDDLTPNTIVFERALKHAAPLPPHAGEKSKNAKVNGR